jgi:AcrR family transcriptional regulator
MDDIVEEAGLSKGAVYWYFESKDEIITTILDRFFERELEDFRQISQGDEPIPDRLLKIMRNLSKEIESIADLMPIIYEFYAVAARENAIRKTIQRYFKSYIKPLEELIKIGMDQGEFREVSPYDVALSLVALIEGCMLIWILGTLDHEVLNLEKLFESSMDLVLEGLVLEA